MEKARMRKKYRNDYKYEPFITKETKVLMKERDNFYNKYKSNEMDHSWTWYKKPTNKVRKEVRKYKQTYENFFLKHRKN